MRTERKGCLPKFLWRFTQPKENNLSPAELLYQRLDYLFTEQIESESEFEGTINNGDNAFVVKIFKGADENSYRLLLTSVAITEEGVIFETWEPWKRRYISSPKETVLFQAGFQDPIDQKEARLLYDSLQPLVEEVSRRQIELHGL